MLIICGTVSTIMIIDNCYVPHFVLVHFKSIFVSFLHSKMQLQCHKIFDSNPFIYCTVMDFLTNDDMMEYSQQIHVHDI